MATNDLHHKIDQLTRMFDLAMKRLDTRLDDQSLQINSMSGLVQLQSERLRKIEVLCAETEAKVKDDVIPAIMSVKEDLKSHKSSVKDIARSNDKMVRLVGDVRKELGQKIEAVTGHLGSKIDRFTRITAFAGTKLKQELSQSKSQPQSPPRTSTSGQQSDVMADISSKMDAMKVTLETQQKKQKKSQTAIQLTLMSIIDQLVTEATITREIMTNQQTPRQSHTGDFFIFNYSDLVGSGRHVLSRLWYLEEKQAYVKGQAIFKTDNTVEICLLYGCCPKEVGREPRDLGDIQVKVKVMPLTGQAQTWELSEKKVRFDEKNIADYCDGWVCTSGAKLHIVSCAELSRRDLVVVDNVQLRFEMKCV